MSISEAMFSVADAVNDPVYLKIETFSDLIAEKCVDADAPVVPRKTYKKILDRQLISWRCDREGTKPYYSDHPFNESPDEPVLMRGAWFTLISRPYYAFAEEVIERYLRRYRLSTYEFRDNEAIYDRLCDLMLKSEKRKREVYSYGRLNIWRCLRSRYHCYFLGKKIDLTSNKEKSKVVSSIIRQVKKLEKLHSEGEIKWQKLIQQAI